jgi:hypothetical protein
MPYKSGVKAFDDIHLMQEMVRQVSVSGATQAQIIAAERIFYRALINAAVAYNISPSVFTHALFSLGVRS